MPITPVDQDRLVDAVAVDDHARKLVGVKAKRDLERFERLTERPLSVKETIGAVIGALLVLGLLLALAATL